MEERFRLILASADIGTWDFDPLTGDLNGDERFRELLGLKPGMRLDFASAFDLVHAADRKQVRERVADALDPAANGDSSVEIRVMRPCDGAERWIVVRGRTISNGGRIMRLLGIVQDITDRKRAEIAREERLQALTHAIQRGEMFLGKLGHDLRNPLSAIATNAGLLLRLADMERIARPAERILGSAQQMGRMVDQLVDFTRLRAGQRLSLVRQKLDLVELVLSAVADLPVAAEAANALQVAVTGDCTGYWDRDRFRQVFFNLADNALRHRIADTPVHLSADGAGTEAVILEVRNQGTIPQDVLAGIFEPWAREDFHSRAGSSGLGLGLYITQQILLAHGGVIKVESTHHAGTCFRVWLPRGRADTQD
jgi:PAS domain S-box-containing protein